MKQSLTIDTKRLGDFQNLAKVHDVRVRGAPLSYGERTYIDVSFEHLPQGHGDAFLVAWHELMWPPEARQPPIWLQWLDRCKERLQSLGQS
jgi:hypothetical protein